MTEGTNGTPNANALHVQRCVRVFGQVVRGKALWRGKFKHKETMVVTRVDVSSPVKTVIVVGRALERSYACCYALTPWQNRIMLSCFKRTVGAHL